MKNKFIVISIIFVLFSFVLINNCFAYVLDPFTINGTTYDFSVTNTPDNWIILYNSKEDTIHFLLHTTNYHDECESVAHYIYEDNDAFYIESKCDHSACNYIHMARVTEEKNGIGEVYNHGFTDTSYLCLGKEEWKIVHMQKPVYSDSSYTTLANLEDYDFFYKSPVATTLAPILGEVEMMEPTMKEILILVPIMIILIVSYLGLRKGLTLLKTLRKM